MSYKLLSNIILLNTILFSFFFLSWFFYYLHFYLFFFALRENRTSHNNIYSKEIILFCQILLFKLNHSECIVAPFNVCSLCCLDCRFQLIWKPSISATHCTWPILRILLEFQILRVWILKAVQVYLRSIHHLNVTRSFDLWILWTAIVLGFSQATLKWNH